jgi:hypothetical protein
MPKAGVGFLGDILFGDRRPEARPAGARLEFGIGAEQRVAAAYAAVDPSIVQLVVLAGEGRLGAFLAGDRKLLRSELALPFFIALDYFFGGHNSYSLS